MQVKLHEDMAQMPIVPNPATLPSFSYSVSVTSWEVLYDQLTEEEMSQAWFIDGYA